MPSMNGGTICATGTGSPPAKSRGKSAPNRCWLIFTRRPPGDLYAAIEREMQRIGWDAMVRQGTALFIRKLDDQRYAVFYRTPTRHYQIIIANIVHLALGHTVKQADHLHTKTTDRVLSGYELQEDFFRCVEETARVGGGGRARDCRRPHYRTAFAQGPTAVATRRHLSIAQPAGGNHR